MTRRITTIAAGAVAALTLAAGPAAAAPSFATPADGACVSNGVQALGGKGARAIGGAASALGPQAISGVILAHLNGEDPLSNACS